MNKWISVKDRLPELPNWVIVVNVTKEVYPAYFSQGVWYDDWQDEVREWAAITHWMPLPDPPKE